MPVKRATVHTPAANLSSAQIVSRHDLVARGMSSQAITRAVKAQELVRVRRGHYALPDTPRQIVEAVRVGGRIACVSWLSLLGAFVHLVPTLHVQMTPHMSRTRQRRPDEASVHWGRCSRVGLPHAVSVWDAVRQAVRCQSPRAAIATLDSVLHLGLLTRRELDGIFEELPKRFGVLLGLVDGAAESGPETFMRLNLRALGVRFETQVPIPGVGRVDFVVEGWLIIECDSRAFHEGWDSQVRDRRRDLAAAQLGYITVRPLASDILWRGTDVRHDIERVIDAFSGQLTAPGVSQLRRTRRKSAPGARSVFD